MMTKRGLALSLAALVIWRAPSNAHAQMAVIDPANLAQSITQVAHLVEQLRNQVRQIDQATAMLRQNPLQLSSELSQSIEQARSLFADVEGIAFEANSLGEDIRALYPNTWEEFNLGAVLSQSDAWMRESRQGLERAMRAEAHATAAIGDTRSRIDRALQSSSAAEGQPGAIQASNQLLGVQAGQLAEIQALLVAQGRALNLERMERLAREQRAAEIRRRAFPTTRHAIDPARSAF